MSSIHNDHHFVAEGEAPEKRKRERERVLKKTLIKLSIMIMGPFRRPSMAAAADGEIIKKKRKNCVIFVRGAFNDHPQLSERGGEERRGKNSVAICH